MPALPLRACVVGAVIACLGGTASAQEEEEPPIDPYSEAPEPPEAKEAPAPETVPPEALETPTATGEADELPAYPVMPTETQAPAKRAERSGLIGGLALGIGTVGAGGESDGTLNYGLSFGGYINSSLALLVELGGARAQDDDFRIDTSKQGLAALYWLDRSVWTKVIVSSASYTTYVDDFMLSEFQGLAFGAGLGWVFYSRGDFYLDARASLTIEAYRDARDEVTSSALQLGVHYF